MIVGIILIVIGIVGIAAVGIAASKIQNNDQKKVIKVTKSLYHLPKKYQFGDYKYWVDYDGYHNYCHVDGSNGAITMNVRDMRKHDPIFKELNDLYYKAIGHTPQWLRDEKKDQNPFIDHISLIVPIHKDEYELQHYERLSDSIQQHLTQQPMTLIEQLREGKIAIQNTGCYLKELKQVLRVAFPNDLWPPATGESAYYFKNPFSNDFFIMANSTDLPVYPVRDFIQELNNQKPIMKKRIKYTEAQEIIDLACPSAWQPKLAKLWGVDIAMKKDIEVSEELYQEGRKAANDKQNELLDRIFGKDKPQYKVGDWIIVIERVTRDSQRFNKQCLQISKIPNNDCVEVSGSSTGLHNGSGKWEAEFRLATPEEIKKAQYLPEGTPCFVRENKDYSWKLAYADGNGNFYKNGKKSGDTYKWNFVHKYSDGLPEE